MKQIPYVNVIVVDKFNGVENDDNDVVYGAIDFKHLNDNQRIHVL